MMRKTQGVYDLAAEVLNTLPTPYSEDIIEDVFVAINATWHTRYKELEAELTGKVVNAWIGQYVKQITGMKTVKEVSAKRTDLIKDYTKLAH